MANLSYAQLKRVWLDASQGTRYHSNAWASLMAAIALAESSGDPNATNPADNGGTQTSWGLWQISNGDHSTPSPNWASPVVNAQLAIHKLNDQGLGAWGTYTSGAYKAYYNGRTTPSDTVPATGGTATQATAELTAAQVSEQQSAAGRCALGYSQHVGIFFGHGPTIQFCVISKTQVRAVMGGVYIVAGGLTVLVGVAIVIVATAPGVAGRVAGRLAARVPGGGRAVAATPRPAGARSPVGRASGEPFRYATPRPEAG